jgi:hypothetical protein
MGKLSTSLHLQRGQPKGSNDLAFSSRYARASSPEAEVSMHHNAPQPCMPAEITMSHAPSIHYLHRYQTALSALPEETGIFVVEGIGDNPKEVFGVFLDRASATIWCAQQRSPLDFSVRPFTIFRRRGSELTYLRPGEPDPKDSPYSRRRSGS